MSEALEKVRGVKFLPLFSLPLVLLPNEVLPLHIFEPRYRQMLRDVQLQKNLFGLSYFDSMESGSTNPEPGSYGCAAEIREVQTLDDGRSNILSIGVIRYVLESYVESGEPYAVGKVSFFEDDDGEDAGVLQSLADEVFELFTRFAKAARELSGERQRVQFPEIQKIAPYPFSFLVAAAFNFQPEIKFEFMKMRSTTQRLEKLRGILGQSIERIETGAQINRIAKTNGHTKQKINLD